MSRTVLKVTTLFHCKTDPWKIFPIDVTTTVVWSHEVNNRSSFTVKTKGLKSKKRKQVQLKLVVAPPRTFLSVLCRKSSLKSESLKEGKPHRWSETCVHNICRQRNGTMAPFTSTNGWNQGPSVYMQLHKLKECLSPLWEEDEITHRTWAESDQLHQNAQLETFRFHNNCTS